MEGPPGGGRVQVPLGAGVPPKCSIKGKGVEFSQTVMVRLVPAFGGCTMETVIVVLELAQGGSPATVYVYVPGGVTPGMKEPLNTAVLGAGPVHTPFASGFPVSTLNKFTLAPPEHSVILPPFPQRGARFSVTVTMAISEAQGAVPVTV